VWGDDEPCRTRSEPPCSSSPSPRITVPPKTIRHNAEKYTAVPVEYEEFPGRPHFPGVPGWEEVADYALTWAVDHSSIKERNGGRDRNRVTDRSPVMILESSYRAHLGVFGRSSMVGALREIEL
jgi:hypothetical protein